MPTFDDYAALLDTATGIYRAATGDLLAVTQAGRGWVVETLAWTEDDAEGDGQWTTVAHGIYASLRAAVTQLRTQGARRIRSVAQF